MADNLSKEKRSWNMSRVKSRNTSIELSVRKYLFKNGFRYRINVRSLPGCPDIVLKKYKTVIFINGCYWHRHPYCKNTRTPKSNIEFWEHKFATNIHNDYVHYNLLESMGWKVIVIWECEIRTKFFDTMAIVINELYDSLISFNNIDTNNCIPEPYKEEK